MPKRWWITVVLLVIAFFLIDHDFHASQRSYVWDTEGFVDTDLAEAIETGAMTRKVGFVAVALIGLYQLAESGSRRLGLHSVPAVCALLFVGLCFASLAWSADAPLTVRRLIIMALMFLGVLGLCRHYDARQLCVVLISVTGAFLLIGVVAEMLLGSFKPFAGDYRFSGTSHPNMTGTLAAVTALGALCLASADIRRRMLMAVAAGSVVLLLLTRSRSSLAGFGLALFVLFLISAPRGYKPLLALGGVWAASLAAFVTAMLGKDPIANASSILLMGREEEVRTLTGRTELWKTVYGDFLQRPLLGYGYGSFWTPDRSASVAGEVDWQVHDAHNGYLEMLLNVGVVGTAILLVGALVALILALAAYRKSGNSGYSFFVAIIVFGLIGSMLEAEFVIPSFIAFVAVAGVCHIGFVPAQPIMRVGREPLPLPLTTPLSQS